MLTVTGSVGVCTVGNATGVGGNSIVTLGVVRIGVVTDGSSTLVGT